MPRRARIAVAVLLAALALGAVLAGEAAAAPAAPAATPFRIDQARIGRAPLGKPVAFYKTAYATPSRRYADDDGFDRLVFDDWHLAVLFEPGRDAAVAVITWAARTTTAAGVGPCSTARTLQTVYRGKLARVASGSSISAFRLGRLVFTVGHNGFVSSVALLAPGVSVGVALTAPSCGTAAVG